MKHNIKLVLALALAVMMIVGSISAIAADGDLGVDSTISISGLDVGDTVNLFKVLEWTDGVGWTITTNFAALTTAGDANESTGVKALVAGTTNTQLSADDVKKITTVAQGNTATASEKITTSTYSYSTTAAPGMYLALITAATPGVVYNPIIVSADFTADNGTDTIPASSAINGTAVAKKKPVTLLKTEPKITNDVGDEYVYTIQTTIPVYSEAFTNTYFTVTDTLSAYLDYVDNSIAVKDTDTNTTIDVSNYFTKTNAQNWKITFPHAYVSALSAAQNITITYNAKLNVPVAQLTNVKEENNKVTVEFPNNPNDITGKKVTALYDETREYTFTIDGSLFGNTDWHTAELVKIGVDAGGNPIESVINVSNGSSHAALVGAKFGVYTDAATASSESTTAATFNDDGTVKSHGLYTNDVFNGYVFTDAQGLMKIGGLDAGTYYIKELDAPNGYIRDTTVHHFTITPTYVSGGVDVTKYYTVNETTGAVTWSDTKTDGSIAYTYNVPNVLASYTVQVDDQKTSTFTMTNAGPSISSVTPAESSTDISNTKGVELPSTGGIGTTIFYVGGSLMVLAAAILLITKRRMGVED